MRYTNTLLGGALVLGCIWSMSSSKLFKGDLPTKAPRIVQRESSPCIDDVADGTPHVPCTLAEAMHMAIDANAPQPPADTSSMPHTGLDGDFAKSLAQFCVMRLNSSTALQVSCTNVDSATKYVHELEKLEFVTVAFNAYEAHANMSIKMRAELTLTPLCVYVRKLEPYNSILLQADAASNTKQEAAPQQTLGAPFASLI